MQADQSKVMWAVIICSLIILVAGFFMVNSVKNAMPEIPTIVVPTADEISANVLAGVVIPTAEEVADAIDMPDTRLSVEDDEKELAIELSKDELSDRDVEEDLAEYITNNCDGTNIDRHDITRVSVRDSDVRLQWIGDGATVELELKVYYDNYGDDEESESARVLVEFEIDNLDRDDDYEDAEVDDFSIEELQSCTTD